MIPDPSQPADLRRQLKAHGVQATKSRVAILSRLAAARPEACSQYDLERDLAEVCDRTTIYRSLLIFEEAGLVHRVPHLGSAARYAQTQPADEGSNTHEHMHFFCESCGRTFCLDEEAKLKLNLPKNLEARDFELLVRGRCESCLYESGSLA